MTTWHTLSPAVRRAIMREAVRRGIAIDQFYATINH